MEVAKNIPDHYPDLVRQGGLASSIEAALIEIGSSLSVSRPEGQIPFITQVRIESGNRFSQVFSAAAERLFLIDFWRLGVCLAQGSTPSIGDAAKSIHKWISSDCRAEELASTYKFVRLSPNAAAYEGST